MKGQVTMIEAITSILILFITFSILFPFSTKKTRWDDAYLLVKGRDLILTMDRIGALEKYSFNATSLQSFIDKAANDTIVWTSIDGTVKNRLVIACNCTDDQISQLIHWTKDLKFNNRSITVHICKTDLEGKINPCFIYLKYPDILVIWGYKDLSGKVGLMRRFLNEGNGILQIANITAVDNAQREIFGIGFCSGSCNYDSELNNSFIKPVDSSALTYEPFKYFYHVPFPDKAHEIVGSIPLESGEVSCRARKGNFIFREIVNSFWICDDRDSEAYFDTNNNGKADMIVNTRSSFILNGSNFYLNYVEKNSSILISFRPTYNFKDFLKANNLKLKPVDDNNGRILLSAGNYSGTSNPVPVVIVNGTLGKTAWVPDLSLRGFGNIGDDYKHLVNSLLLFVSNKRAKEPTYGAMMGSTTSYVDVMNYDMFEIYKLNLGVAKPF